jgi:hypothetical protein
MHNSAAFDDAVLGRGLPAAVAEALHEAGALRAHDAAGAMAALMRARALAPEHPAVLVALYRHHFYGHRLHAAHDVARQALLAGARALGLPVHWREVPPRALADAATDAAVRFYLFALKGYAYLSLRLGDRTDAERALAQLQALDPADAVGAAVLAAVLQAQDAGDDESPIAPRGWIGNTLAEHAHV